MIRAPSLHYFSASALLLLLLGVCCELRVGAQREFACHVCTLVGAECTIYIACENPWVAFSCYALAPILYALQLSYNTYVSSHVMQSVASWSRVVRIERRRVHCPVESVTRIQDTGGRKALPVYVSIVP